MEYVAKITETIISLKNQFKRLFLQCRVRSSALISFLSWSSGSSFEHIQQLTFVKLLALRPVYLQVLITQFSIICHNSWFSHSGSHIEVTITKAYNNLELVKLVPNRLFN